MEKKLLSFLIFSLIFVNSYSQNVGIGTDNPQQKLSVFGGNLMVDNIGVQSNFLSRRANGTVALPTNLVINDVIGSYNFQSFREGSAYINTARIVAVADESHTNNSLATRLEFRTTSSGSNAGAAERMRITNSGDIGINTTEPKEKLHVFGNLMVGTGTNSYFSTPAGAGAITLNGSTIGSMFRIVANDGSSTINMYQNAYYDGTNWKYNAGTEATRISSSSGTFDFRVAPSGTAGDNITWRNALHINNLGYVGIRNTSPESELDVKGTLRISGATSGYVGITVPAAAGSTTYTLPASDGTNGQVLSTNGSGTLGWIAGGNNEAINQSYFETGRTVLTTTGQQTWSVPAGVTRIRVHLVGGGGGGHDNSGQRSSGGGGSYVTGELVVNPTETLYLNVGSGGTGRTNNNDSGGGVGSYIRRDSHSGTLLAAAGGGGGGRRGTNGDGRGGGQAFSNSNFNGGNGTTGSAGGSGNSYIGKLSGGQSYVGKVPFNSQGDASGVFTRNFTTLYNASTDYGAGGTQFGSNGTQGVIVIEW